MFFLHVCVCIYKFAGLVFTKVPFRENYIFSSLTTTPLAAVAHGIMLCVSVHLLNVVLEQLYLRFFAVSLVGFHYTEVFSIPSPPLCVSEFPPPLLGSSSFSFPLFCSTILNLFVTALIHLVISWPRSSHSHCSR